MIKEYERHKKNQMDILDIDKEGVFKWLRRGQHNWDEERIVINAKHQGHDMNGFNKMAGLSQSDKCRFCKVETESMSHLLLGCKNSCQNSCTHKGTTKYIE